MVTTMQPLHNKNLSCLLHWLQQTTINDPGDMNLSQSLYGYIALTFDKNIDKLFGYFKSYESLVSSSFTFFNWPWQSSFIPFRTQLYHWHSHVCFDWHFYTNHILSW